MGDQNKKWYVVRAISGQEKKVKAYIEHEIAQQKLEHAVSQCWSPQKKCTKSEMVKRPVRKRIIFLGISWLSVFWR